VQCDVDADAVGSFVFIYFCVCSVLVDDKDERTLLLLLLLFLFLQLLLLLLLLLLSVSVAVVVLRKEGTDVTTNPRSARTDRTEVDLFFLLLVCWFFLVCRAELFINISCYVRLLAGQEVDRNWKSAAP